MLTLFPVLILLLTPAVMLSVRLAKPDFAYFWLIAALGAMLAFPMVLALGFRLPQSVALITWEPAGLFSTSPALLVDAISWPYAAALAALALSVILTAVARLQSTNWRAWAGALALSGLSLLAVLAGNPLTLLLAWAALDLTELLVLLLHVRDSKAREQAVFAFSARAAGIALLLWSDIAGGTPGRPLSFDAIPPQVSLYLLLAAALRLGVVPLHPPYLETQTLRRGLGTILHLAPAAASLVLLSRAALAGAPAVYVPYLLGLTGLSALYSAFTWATAGDELAGRPNWVLGMASLSVAAAVLGHPSASLAWGLASLLSGALLFLLSARHRSLLLLVFLSLFGFSGLPFSPAWEGMRLFSSPFNPFLLVFLLAQAMLLAGYARHSLREEDTLAGTERWVWVIYPLGLVLLPMTHVFLGLRLQPELASVNSAAWVSGLLAAGLAGLIWLIDRRGWLRPGPALTAVEAFFSLRWLYRLFWGLYRLLGWPVTRISRLLEGEAGLLWSLVLLVILFSLLSQRGIGD